MLREATHLHRAQPASTTDTHGARLRVVRQMCRAPTSAIFRQNDFLFVYWDGARGRDLIGNLFALSLRLFLKACQCTLASYQRSSGLGGGAAASNLSRYRR
jgi:hypothetical protein